MDDVELSCPSEGTGPGWRQLTPSKHQWPVCKPSGSETSLKIGLSSYIYPLLPVSEHYQSLLILIFHLADGVRPLGTSRFITERAF